MEADLATAKEETAAAKARLAGPAGLVGTVAADAGVVENDELVKNVEETASFIVNSFWGAASAATAALHAEAQGSDLHEPFEEYTRLVASARLALQQRADKKVRR